MNAAIKAAEAESASVQEGLNQNIKSQSLELEQAKVQVQSLEKRVKEKEKKLVQAEEKVSDLQE